MINFLHASWAYFANHSSFARSFTCECVIFCGFRHMYEWYCDTMQKPGRRKSHSSRTDSSTYYRLLMLHIGMGSTLNSTDESLMSTMDFCSPDGAEIIFGSLSLFFFLWLNSTVTDGMSTKNCCNATTSELLVERKSVIQQTEASTTEVTVKIPTEMLIGKCHWLAMQKTRQLEIVLSLWI